MDDVIGSKAFHPRTEKCEDQSSSDEEMSQQDKGQDSDEDAPIALPPPRPRR
jgi:hypothetical protein